MTFTAVNNIISKTQIKTFILLYSMVAPPDWCCHKSNILVCMMIFNLIRNTFTHLSLKMWQAAWYHTYHLSRKWPPTPVCSPGKCHGQRNLTGYSSQGCRVGQDWSDLACHCKCWYSTLWWLGGATASAIMSTSREKCDNWKRPWQLSHFSHVRLCATP